MSGSLRVGAGFSKLQGLTPLALDLFADEGYLFQLKRTKTTVNRSGRQSETHQVSVSSRQCYITPLGYRAVDSNFNPSKDILVSKPPVEITESLAQFRADYPDSNRLAFVMMQFGATDAHEKIVQGIQKALEPHGLVALRADDKQYHDDLYSTFSRMSMVLGLASPFSRESKRTTSIPMFPLKSATCLDFKKTSAY